MLNHKINKSNNQDLIQTIIIVLLAKILNQKKILPKILEINLKILVFEINFFDQEKVFEVLHYL
jgi:hypothetical protein